MQHAVFFSWGAVFNEQRWTDNHDNSLFDTKVYVPLAIGVVFFSLPTVLQRKRMYTHNNQWFFFCSRFTEAKKIIGNTALFGFFFVFSKERSNYLQLNKNRQGEKSMYILGVIGIHISIDRNIDINENVTDDIGPGDVSETTINKHTTRWYQVKLHHAQQVVRLGDELLLNLKEQQQQQKIYAYCSIVRQIHRQREKLKSNDGKPAATTPTMQHAFVHLLFYVPACRYFSFLIFSILDSRIFFDLPLAYIVQKQSLYAPLCAQMF